MPPSSALTTSGLLYEGNFDEWLPRMSAALAQYGQYQVRSSHTKALYVRCDWDVDIIRHGATIIWCHASPYVRLRVPDKDRMNPTTLIRALRELARPFRMMDLPPEIRLRIYLFSLPPYDSEDIWLLERLKDRGSSQKFEDTNRGITAPPLMSVSRQVRLEALPVYLQTTTLNLIFSAHHYSNRTI